jgi:hypothetical protein
MAHAAEVHVVAHEPVTDHAVRERGVLHGHDVARADDPGAIVRDRPGVATRDRRGLPAPRQLCRRERRRQQVEDAKLRLRDDLGREAVPRQLGKCRRHPRGEQAPIVATPILSRVASQSDDSRCGSG